MPECTGCYWDGADGCGVPDDMEPDESMKCYVEHLEEQYLLELAEEYDSELCY